MDILKLIGRTAPLFDSDILSRSKELDALVSNSRFLVIGGAGSIGQAVTCEIFKRNPLTLHVVDISENNMVELVRDIRSTLGYIDGDFRTFAIDCGSNEYRALMNASERYDYVLNLSALKHVRSEKDPFTLMRLIEVNILNTIKTVQMAKLQGAKKYFCVSTDKAANPVNMMGASKKIMEMFLFRDNTYQNVSTARFANVAFSDGSLLHGFDQRFLKNQPFSAPTDIKRYFMTSKESGELCLLSGLIAENRETYFPKFIENKHLVKFSDIAIKYLKSNGYEPFLCDTENEARQKAEYLISKKLWPCYFFESDTTGEKSHEEFYDKNENIDLDTFSSIGIIQNKITIENSKLDNFLESLEALRRLKVWNKKQLLDLYFNLIPSFNHLETGKYLDDRM